MVLAASVTLMLRHTKFSYDLARVRRIIHSHFSSLMIILIVHIRGGSFRAIINKPQIIQLEVPDKRDFNPKFRRFQ
jgi:hypothetical protein